MRVCFADAFFFLAWWNRRDLAHEAAVRFLTRYAGEIVTTRWILMEVADGLASSRVRKRIKAAFERLEGEPRFRIIEPSAELSKRALALYDSRPDKEWSLTDCTSFTVMSDLGISEALTADKHFEQAGFVALFK
jgi:predicted nucleic acid-binding protein